MDRYLKVVFKGYGFASVCFIIYIYISSICIISLIYIHLIFFLLCIYISAVSFVSLKSKNLFLFIHLHSE